MNILVSAATREELGPFVNSNKLFKNIHSRSIVSGVGMVSAVFELTSYCLDKKPDLILNIGLCGSFRSEWKLTETVNVIEDIFPELGAEDEENFIDIFDLGLVDQNLPPFKQKKLYPYSSPELQNLIALRKCSAVTVNTVHGNTESITKFQELWNADVETMEGASHFYVSQKLKIPCLQIRAISNYVEKRDRSKWRIDEALQNLWECAELLMSDIDKQ